MDEKIKTKSLKLFLAFLGAMVVMTFVSRGIYANNLPRVSAVSMTNQALSQTVKCSGSLETSRNQPVLIPPELLISEVYVKPGDALKAGDLLLQFDMEYLSEKIAALEAELQAEQKSNPDFYQSEKETPIFTQPGLRISEICVKAGDTVAVGDILMKLDFHYLLDYINQLEADLNASLLTRDSYNQAEDYRSAEILNYSIEEKQKTLQKYRDIYAYSGVIYCQNPGVITSVAAVTGGMTGETAIFIVSENPEISYAVQEKQSRLAEYRLLAEQNACIQSQSDGIVTDVHVHAGEFSANTSAFLMADSLTGLYFSANITEEDARLLSVGDLVNLSFRNGRIQKGECKITSVMPAEANGMYRIEIPMEQSELTYGEIGQLTVNILSEERYDLIPLDAIHTEDMQKYIFVIEEREGFLGTEFHVKKRIVNVVGQNDRYAAIRDSGISTSDKIVGYSTKDLSDGQTVRMA